jgi:hypothetical protein
MMRLSRRWRGAASNIAKKLPVGEIREQKAPVKDEGFCFRITSRSA